MILEVRNLKKVYTSRSIIFKKPAKKVLDGFELELKRGEILGIVGDSGCGKSTLAKILLGIIKPDQASIVIDGELVFDDSRGIDIYRDSKTSWYIKDKIQIIMQDPYESLDPKQMVGIMVADGLRKHDRTLSKDQAIDMVKETFKLCGLEEEYFYRFPYELSGGQRQRVSIARTLVLRPDIIVCDEITSALDVSVQSQILKLMLDLKERFDLSYIFISHDKRIVDMFCNRVINMTK